MRRHSFIALFLCVVVLVMAGTSQQFWKRKKKNLSPQESAEPVDSVVHDSLGNVAVDTTKMDSLQKAIVRYNKAIDDSIRLDSINRAKASGIDAPVNYEAQDSLVYDAASQTAHLYGSSKVGYQSYNLTSDRIKMSMGSDLVHAVGTPDSTAEGGVKGKPVFKMGSDQYDTDTIAFNFKSKKAYIDNVYTEQQDGFLRGEKSKRDSTGLIYLQHGKYTTCDKDDPDFYIALSRARVRPGKDVVFGPAYLVVADVPLPFAIPYGFFPFTKSYSSGFIMPTYGDESDRGFYLRDGGYYFAINDKWDLKLLGEIYTKGSWGVSAASNYQKRYRYSGSFLFSYQDTKSGEKGMPDFSETTSFKVQWSHRQDSKANPYSSFSASVNFATQSYERNNLSSLYNPQTMTQSTRTSSVSWSTSFSSLGMTLSSTANLSQNMRDSSLSVTLPDLNINVSRFYPFRRKAKVGEERWYEKIGFTYKGQLKNSIDTKEDQFFKSNLIKDWQNGMKHDIGASASFTALKYININPSFSFSDRMQTSKITRSWDTANQEELRDTTYGFYNIYDWSLSVSASTKLYGFYIPSRKLFGDKIQAIRHVLSPTVSFSYAPNFGSSQYGYYDTYLKTDANGNVSIVQYSPYNTGVWSVPSNSKTGSINVTLGNNIEMKVKSDKDSTGYKKLSIIDDLSLSMGYNMAAKVRPWSDLSVNLRLKWWKNYTFNMNAVFATYAYELDANGNPYIGTHTEYSKGRFGRFQGMSQNISYTLNPEKIKKFFSGSDDEEDDKPKKDEEGIDTDIETNVDKTMVDAQHGAKKSSTVAETDDDGYMAFSMPWSLTFSYGITLRENTSGTFNKESMRYPYKVSQTLNFSGNIRISEGWNISFSSGYDFDYHKISMTTASLQRDLHCFNMSCSVVLAPYTSYNFSFRCNAATLTDALKYDKRSGYSNAVQWY